MVSLGALWLPILVAAVILFLGSWALHMLLPHHKKDFARLPDEEGFLSAARAAGTRPGLYNFPYMSSPEAFKDAGFKKKCDDGPVGILTIGPNGLPNMGKMLGQQFVYGLVVSFLAAYVAHITVEAGAEYMLVFRVTATVTWIAYATAHFSASIWFYQPWSISWKYAADGLVYGLLAGGVFGWLWP